MLQNEEAPFILHTDYDTAEWTDEKKLFAHAIMEDIWQRPAPHSQELHKEDVKWHQRALGANPSIAYRTGPCFS